MRGAVSPKSRALGFSSRPKQTWLLPNRADERATQRNVLQVAQQAGRGASG